MRLLTFQITAVAAPGALDILLEQNAEMAVFESR